MTGVLQYDTLVSKARHVFRRVPCYRRTFEKALPVLFVIGTVAMCCFLYNEEFLRFGSGAALFPDVKDVSQTEYEQPSVLDLLPIDSSFWSRTPGSTIFGDFIPRSTSPPHTRQNATSTPKSAVPMTFTEWEDDPIQENADDFRELFECNTKNQRSDVCLLRGDVRLDAKNDVIVLYAKDKGTKRRKVGVRAYTRKWEAETMEAIHETTIISMDQPQADSTYNQNLSPGTEYKTRRLLTREEECMGAVDKCGEKNEGGRRISGGEVEEDGLKEKVVERVREEEVDEGSLSLSEFSSLLNLPHSHVIRKKAYTYRLRPYVTQKELLSIVNSTSLEKLFGPLDDVVEYSQQIVSDGVDDVMMTCDVPHNVPAVLFSTSGFTGNIFHDFNDGLIPLFITIQHHKGEVVLLIEQAWYFWFTKYEFVIRKLSNYPPVLIGRDTYIHCFTDVTVGLKIHGDLVIDPTKMRDGKGMRDFQNLLGIAWNGHVVRDIPLPCRPRVTLILRRDNTRRITNEEELGDLLFDLGYTTRVLEPKNNDDLQDLWTELQQTEVLLGVHGAALTHLLFMRPGSVFIQIVPWGLKWASETFYGNSAKRLGLNYFPYDVRVEESSLYEKYSEDDQVLTNPQAVADDSWQQVKKIYLGNQNVTVDLGRLRLLFLNKIHPYIHAWPPFVSAKVNMGDPKSCDLGCHKVAFKCKNESVEGKVV